MEQRDILKDQIEALGKVLGKLISEFLDLKATGEVNEAIQVTNHQLKEEIEIDVEAMLYLNKKDLKEFVGSKHFGEKSLEDLSDYFREIGDSKMDSSNSEDVPYFQKAIELLELADEFSKVFSLDRMEKKKELENILKNRNSDFNEILETENLYLFIIEKKSNWDKFYEMANLLTAKLKINFTNKVDDFDCRYWDFIYDEIKFTLHFHEMLQDLEIYTDKENGKEEFGKLLIEIHSVI